MFWLLFLVVEIKRWIKLFFQHFSVLVLSKTRQDGKIGEKNEENCADSCFAWSLDIEARCKKQQGKMMTAICCEKMQQLFPSSLRKHCSLSSFASTHIFYFSFTKPRRWKNVKCEIFFFLRIFSSLVAPLCLVFLLTFFNFGPVFYFFIVFIVAAVFKLWLKKIWEYLIWLKAFLLLTSKFNYCNLLSFHKTLDVVSQEKAPKMKMKTQKCSFSHFSC